MSTRFWNCRVTELHIILTLPCEFLDNLSIELVA